MLFVFGFYGHFICFGFVGFACARVFFVIVAVAHSLRFTHVEMVHIKPFLMLWPIF